MSKKTKRSQPLNSPKTPVRHATMAKVTNGLSNIDYLGMAVILFITCLIFLPVLSNGFVNWDDDRYIQNNQLITSLNFKALFSTYVEGNYHPFTMLTYALEYKFFGVDPKGYHLVNLFIHLANVILVFYAVYYLCNKPMVALVASFLFAIHPIHVESVAWASELKDLLYTFFFLASYIFYLKFVNSGTKRFYVFSLVLFLCSLLSKAMAASLPVILLLTDYFMQKEATGIKGILNTKRLIEKIPFFLLSLVFGIVAVFAQQAASAIGTTVFAFPQRIVFACYGFMAYLFKLVLPINLCAVYPYPVKPGMSIPLEYYLYLLLFIALVVAVYYTAGLTKKIIFGIGFFAVTVFLVLQILPVGEAVMADRYSYIPSIGLFYLAGEGFYWTWNTKYKIPSIVMLALFAIFFSFKTHERAGIWKSGMILWNDVISQTQIFPTAYYNRGNLFTKDKKYKEAYSDFSKAIELKPNYTDAYNNRGNAYLDEKKYDEALVDFTKALELKPDFISIYYNRGILYGNLKKYDLAYSDYNKALELNPNYIEVFINRGNLYRDENKFDEAINDYNKAIKINPNFSKAYSNRGILFMTQKKYEDAITDFSKVILLKTDLPMAYYSRGMANYYLGKKGNACPDLLQAANLGIPPAKELYNQTCK